MSRENWRHQNEEELTELMTQHKTNHLEGTDAWRALVLNGRLELFAQRLSQDGQNPLQLDKIAPETKLSLASKCEFPDPVEVIDELEQELISDSEPFGSLMDVIVDIDDLCVVYASERKNEVVQELSRHTVALLSLFSERLISLSGWAWSRLETIPEGHDLALLWSEVALAPGQVLVNAQPAAPEGKSLMALPDFLRRQIENSIEEPEAAHLSLHPTLSIALPMIPLSATASTASSDSFEYPLYEGQKEVGVLYFDTNDQHLSLSLRLPINPNPNIRLFLQAYDVDSDEVIDEVLLSHVIDGPELHVDLGPYAGPENVLRQMLAKANLPHQQALFRIRLDDTT